MKSLKTSDISKSLAAQPPTKSPKSHCPAKKKLSAATSTSRVIVVHVQNIGITNIKMPCNVAYGAAGTACKACSGAVILALYYNMMCSCVSTGLQ